jgi:hypothetical protein
MASSAARGYSPCAVEIANNYSIDMPIERFDLRDGLISRLERRQMSACDTEGQSCC